MALNLDDKLAKVRKVETPKQTVTPVKAKKKAKTVLYNFNIDPEQLKLLKMKAIEEDKTVTALILEALNKVYDLK